VRTYDEKDDMLIHHFHRLKYTPIANTHQIINHFNTKTLKKTSYERHPLLKISIINK
jgi:hypothetical protein